MTSTQKLLMHLTAVSCGALVGLGLIAVFHIGSMIACFIASMVTVIIIDQAQSRAARGVPVPHGVLIVADGGSMASHVLDDIGGVHSVVNEGNIKCNHEMGKWYPLSNYEEVRFCEKCVREERAIA